MPILSTSRPILSDLLKGCSDYSSKSATRFNFATVGNVNSSATIDNIGFPLVWDDTTSRFQEFSNTGQIAAAITANTSPLPNAAPVCVTVGGRSGLGENYEDTDLNLTHKLTVLFRGDATVVKEGFNWVAAGGADQLEFYKQLEKQGIAVITDAPESTPTHV